LRDRRGHRDRRRRKPAVDKVSRLDDLAQSAQILRSIILEIAAHNPSGILLIAANPVDVLTYAAWS
jgi:malate/lactate dehydrogenase